MPGSAVFVCPFEPATSSKSSLEAAMERFASGDDRAFAELYQLSAPRIYGLFLRFCEQPAAADDLVQETYLRVYRARQRYRRGSKVLPWMYAIARHLVIDRRRARRKARAMGDVYCSHMAMWGGPPRADEEIAAKRMASAVVEILDRIPPAQARAFRLVKEEGASIEEAATMLGDTSLALRLRMHRACKAIREGLREHA